MTWWTPYRRKRHNELFTQFIKEMFIGDPPTKKSDKPYNGLSKRGMVRANFLKKMKMQEMKDKKQKF